MKKSSHFWKSREVRVLDHEQTPLQGFVGPGSVAVKETTTEHKNRTLPRYGVCSLVAITEGASKYVISGHELYVEAPSLLIRPPGGDLSHQGILGIDCTSEYFCLSGAISNLLLPLVEEPVPYVYFPNEEGRLFRLLREAVDLAFENSWDTPWRLSERFSELLRELMGEIPILRVGERSVARRLNAAVEGNWNVPRSANDAAELLGLSRSELYRQFEYEEDCSPAEWMRRQRIELAKHHLLNGLNVSEVADLLNFSSPYALSRVFYEVTGQRPKELKSS